MRRSLTIRFFVITFTVLRVYGIFVLHEKMSGSFVSFTVVLINIMTNFVKNNVTVCVFSGKHVTLAEREIEIQYIVLKRGF